MATLQEKIQRMPRNQKIIVAVLFVLAVLSMVLIILAVATESTEEKTEKTKQQAVEKAESATQQDEYSSYTIASFPERNFQITYLENVDRFDIFIDTGGRDAQNFLTEAEVAAVRKDAETYFVDEVAQTRNRNVLCSLNVRISTVGYGASLEPVGLSFCE